jgi:hypothetical protein
MTTCGCFSPVCSMTIEGRHALAGVFLADGLTDFDVLEAHRAGLLRQNRRTVRIPIDELVAPSPV